MKLFSVGDEKIFTIGMILAVLFLYSTSVYNIFSVGDDSSTMREATAQTTSAEPKAAAVENAKILRVMNVDEAGLFRPINAGESIWVPGAECTITNFNLAPDGSLYGVPKDCTFAQRGDR